ncbi:serine/threonine-protein kinase [Micromonospora psammae]|uniref:serine/threonine-protein kinase n=1 Tax=Micromonospora sp. CPCC 205556 TaxID=3122398 RepID=UPI002FF1EE71
MVRSRVQQVMIAGRYRLVELVGRGGMGRVWLARDGVLHREVAVKEVVPPQWLAEAERDELRLRTLREARTAARLNHPNVVRIYDVIRVDDRPWIVMEYVSSRSLQAVLDTTGPVDPRRAADIGLALLAALRAAHAAGVLHRDVKPHNVLVADDGRVMLTDFGLATFDGGDGLMTGPGLVLGSPQFVAPERAADGVSSVEADLWSLGATLHAAVEGRSPYARSTAMATLAALGSSPPDPAPHAGPLRPVLEGLLRRDHRERIGHDEAERLLTAVTRPAPEPPAVLPSAVRPAAVIAPPPPWPGPFPTTAGIDRTDAPAAGAGGRSPSGPGRATGSESTGGTGHRSATEPLYGPTGGAGDADLDWGSPGRPDAGRAVDDDGLVDSDTAFGGAGVVGPGRGGFGTRAARTLRDLGGGARRWALAGAALVVAVAAGVGTALAVTRPDGAEPQVAATGDPRVARPEPPPGYDPNRPGPPLGGPGVIPPPFPCLRPDPVGEPVTIRPATEDDGFRPPSGWTWYVSERYRVAVPVGWLRAREGVVDCFRDPGSRRTLSVEPLLADVGDPSAYLRAEERRQLAAGTLPGYDQVRLATVDGGGARWECRWTTPFQERAHALRLLPGRGAGGALLGWSAADHDWSAAAGQFEVARKSFRGTGSEQVAPT